MLVPVCAGWFHPFSLITRTATRSSLGVLRIHNITYVNTIKSVDRERGTLARWLILYTSTSPRVTYLYLAPTKNGLIEPYLSFGCSKIFMGQRAYKAGLNKESKAIHGDEQRHMPFWPSMKATRALIAWAENVDSRYGRLWLSGMTLLCY